jgi:DNA-binding NarL/FixJ family response regulator
MAERAVGLSSSGQRQLDWLRRAEKTLRASPARVEHARALLELGAAMRRGGQPKEARDPLRNALDEASRCGARPLAERARVELAAAGGRPRRDSLRGADSLTPSERRVAQLAGGGLTNREIAHSLFVSPKTVERHLGNIYVKLGTNDRRQLMDELG